MPFKSEKQRRYLWANEPEIAKKWSDKYGDKPKEAATKEDVKRGLRTGVYSTAGLALTEKGTRHFAEKLIRPTATPADKAAREALEAIMGLPKGSVSYTPFVGKSPLHSSHMGGMGTHVVSAPKKGVEWLSHELGHAKIAPKKLKEMLLRKHLYHKGTAAGLIAAGLMTVSGDKDSLQAKLAPVAVALGAAPQLIEEARASREAMKALKAIKLDPKSLSTARKNLLLGFGTYAAPALVGMGIVHLMNKAREGDKGKK